MIFWRFGVYLKTVGVDPLRTRDRDGDTKNVHLYEDTLGGVSCIKGRISSIYTNYNNNINRIFTRKNRYLYDKNNIHKLMY